MLALFPACNPAVPAPPLPSREGFVEDGLRTSADTRSTFTRSLGEPDSIAAEVIPNRHVPGVRDTILTIHYPDLVARIHRPGGGGELLSSVEVSSNHHLRYPVIGLRRGVIEEAFGAADQVSDTALTYYCTRCVAGNDPVQLFLSDDGSVGRIRFNYYVD